jgi:Excalibur calcium-binding domain
VSAYRSRSGAGRSQRLRVCCAGRTPYRWKNCTIVNKRFPHGVDRYGAHDRTKSGDPVRNFRRSNRLYREAMRYNRGLDRDKDYIACEKH